MEGGKLRFLFYWKPRTSGNFYVICRDLVTGNCRYGRWWGWEVKIAEVICWNARLSSVSHSRWLSGLARFFFQLKVILVVIRQAPSDPVVHFNRMCEGRTLHVSFTCGRKHTMATSKVRLSTRISVCACVGVCMCMCMRVCIRCSFHSFVRCDLKQINKN